MIKLKYQPIHLRFTAITRRLRVKITSNLINNFSGHSMLRLHFQ